MAPICSFWMFGLAAGIELPRALSEGAFANLLAHSARLHLALCESHTDTVRSGDIADMRALYYCR